MRRLKTLKALQNFQTKYKTISGLPVPLAYLQAGQVFGFYDRQNLIGGFVLSSHHQLRTLEVFSSAANKVAIYTKLGSTQRYCEVCCFWMDKIYRQNIFFNVCCWLRMAYQVKKQKQAFILFGTNSKGLALMYAYPKNHSLLYHQDKVKGRNTYVFITRRPDFVPGVWKIIGSKLWSKHSLNFVENDQLRQRIQLEILNHQVV